MKKENKDDCKRQFEKKKKEMVEQMSEIAKERKMIKVVGNENFCDLVSDKNKQKDV